MYRSITDGAGKEIVAHLESIKTTLSGGTATSVSSSDYDDKEMLTETTGRAIATALSAIMSALSSYSAPTATKLSHTLAIGSVKFDGSADKTANTATSASNGLLSSSDKKKIDSMVTVTMNGTAVKRLAFATGSDGKLTITTAT